MADDVMYVILQHEGCITINIHPPFQKKNSASNFIFNLHEQSFSDYPCLGLIR